MQLKYDCWFSFFYLFYKGGWVVTKHDSLFTSNPQTKKESLEDQPYEYTNEEKKVVTKRNRANTPVNNPNSEPNTRQSTTDLSPAERRLDSLALLLEGNGTCAAACFDGSQILVSSNNAYITKIKNKPSNTNTEKFISIVMKYFQLVALQGKSRSSSINMAQEIKERELAVQQHIKELDSDIVFSEKHTDIRKAVFEQICILYLHGLQTEKPSKFIIQSLAEEIMALMENEWVR